MPKSEVVTSFLMLFHVKIPNYGWESLKDEGLRNSNTTAVVTGGVFVHHLTSFVSHLLLAKRRHILSLESSCNATKQTRISFRKNKLTTMSTLKKTRKMS
jgi:hypothetical protein